MQEYFYFSKDGEQVGPVTQLEACQKISNGEFELTDYFYDDSAQDWRLIMEYDVFRITHEKSQKRPTAKPEAPVAKPDQSLEWYALKGENKYGPFTFKDVVRMLQEKKIFEYDYVWNHKLADWKRVAELPEFDPQNIRAMVKEGSGDSEVFFRRRHMRVDYGTSLLIHDNNRVWKGQSLEVSSGGAGLVMANATLKPGDTIYLHFKPGDGVPPFNAACEIVSKAFVQDIAAHDSTVRYGVKFVDISSEAATSVKKFIKSSAA